jgi:anti-anti-sigma factor
MTPQHPGRPLAVDERDVEGVRVLEVQGELDLATAPVLCRRLDAARAERVRRLVVDLTALAFCDSTGLRALMGAGAEVRVDGGRFAVACPSEGPVARLFEVTGVAEALRVFTDPREAIASVARSVL